MFGGVTPNINDMNYGEVYSEINKSWSKLAKPSPCPPVNAMVAQTVCNVMSDKWLPDVQYVVIPTKNEYTDKACTAVLEWPSLMWTKMKYDIRAASIGGQLTTFAGNTRLLYLGGLNDHTEEPSLIIYEFNPKHFKWFQWNARELPCPIWTLSPFTPLNGVKFCEKSKLTHPQLNLDPTGEYQWNSNFHRYNEYIMLLSGGELIYDWESKIAKAPNGTKMPYP